MLYIEVYRSVDVVVEIVLFTSGFFLLYSLSNNHFCPWVAKLSAHYVYKGTMVTTHVRLQTGLPLFISIT